MCTVNSQTYHDMLTSCVVPQLQQRQCLDQTISIQDGAPQHIGVMVHHQFIDHQFVYKFFSKIKYALILWKQFLKTFNNNHFFVCIKIVYNFLKSVYFLSILKYPFFMHKLCSIYPFFQKKMQAYYRWVITDICD